MSAPWHFGSYGPRKNPPADLILCVDDDPLDAFLLQEVAALHGATVEVLHAYDDQEAICLTLGTRPALLLFGAAIDTPGWAQRLRSLHDADPSLPILAWGPPARTTDVHRAIDAGALALAYLAKPTAPDMYAAMMAELWYWLRLRQAS